MMAFMFDILGLASFLLLLAYTEHHTVTANSLPGHLKPLGYHRPSLGTVDSIEGFPTPTLFYEKYLRPNVPVIFKGAAKDLPAFKLWKDDHLRKRYGDVPITAELKRLETRKDGVIDMSFSRFLDIYHEMDIYMVQDITKEMMSELGLPQPLQCGGLESLLNMMILWFSGGGTKSVLHRDDVENINCLLDGKKRLVMIDTKYKEQVEADGWMAGGYSQVDRERVDFDAFPRLAEVDWWESRLEAGDCMYIPIEWYHMVESSEGRNMAVNFWFLHPFWFDTADCDGKQLQSFSPLTDDNLLYLKDDDKSTREFAEQARSHIFRPYEGQDVITLEDFARRSKILELDSKGEEHYIEMFHEFDLNGDAIITWEEVHSADMELIMVEFAVMSFRKEREENEREEL